MTDRELLEKAAKAAGVAGSYDEADSVYEAGIFYTDELDCARWWNPLTDDGDALRLAVKLRITVEPGGEYTYAIPSAAYDFCIEEGRHSTEQAGEAARRAIVRAAAAMAERTA